MVFENGLRSQRHRSESNAIFQYEKPEFIERLLLSQHHLPSAVWRKRKALAENRQTPIPTIEKTFSHKSQAKHLGSF